MNLNRSDLIAARDIASLRTYDPLLDIFKIRLYKAWSEIIYLLNHVNKGGPLSSTMKEIKYLSHLVASLKKSNIFSCIAYNSTQGGKS